MSLPRPRVKICGITRMADLHVALDQGADAIGMVFYPASPRCLKLPTAMDLRAQIPPFVACVALVVNAEATEVERILRELKPDLLQFHGDETPQQCRQFGFPYLRAVRMREADDWQRAQEAYADARGLLLDSFSAGYGGSGQRFDWSLLPHPLPPHIILSGGLNPGNITQAVQQLRPSAVDVSSGVETSPGIKDADKIRAFFAALRQATYETSETATTPGNIGTTGNTGNTGTIGATPEAKPIKPRRSPT